MGVNNFAGADNVPTRILQCEKMPWQPMSDRRQILCFYAYLSCVDPHSTVCRQSHHTIYNYRLRLPVAENYSRKKPSYFLRVFRSEGNSFRLPNATWYKILYLCLYFLYRFVFCIFLFVCNPAFWLLYTNKVMLCYNISSFPDRSRRLFAMMRQQ